MNSWVNHWSQDKVLVVDVPTSREANPTIAKKCCYKSLESDMYSIITEERARDIWTSDHQR